MWKYQSMRVLTPINHFEGKRCDGRPSGPNNLVYYASRPFRAVLLAAGPSDLKQKCCLAYGSPRSHRTSRSSSLRVSVLPLSVSGFLAKAGMRSLPVP